MKQIIDTRHGRMAIHHEHDYISQCLLTQRQYEWYVVEIVKQLCNTQVPGIILDIGGNIGTKCLPLAQLFPEHQIHTWEIQPHLAEILQENIALNSLSNITVYNCALGNTSGSITITLPDYDSAKNIGAFSINPLVQKNSDISRGHGETISVDMKRLDDYQFDLPIQCIKVDAEGSELEILQGSIKTLEQHNFPPVVYELWKYNPWWAAEAQKITNLMTSLGYQIRYIDDTAICTKPQ